MVRDVTDDEPWLDAPDWRPRTSLVTDRGGTAMGVEWWAIRVDPRTRTAIDGVETFFPSAAEWNEIDLVLTGKLEGPISGFLAKCESVPEGEEKCPGWFGAPGVVKALAKRLEAIPPGKFAAPGVVIANWLHSFPTAEERASDPEFYRHVPTPEEFHAHLVGTTEAFRRFVIEAAGCGHAIEVSVGG